MSRDFWPTFVAAYAGPQANPNDPDITRQPVMVQLYGQLQKYQLDLAKGLMDQDTKKEIAYLKQQTELQKKTADFAETIVKEKAAGNRASVAARAGIYKSASASATKLATLRTTVNEDQLREIELEATGLQGRGLEDRNQAMVVAAFSTGYQTIDPAMPDDKGSMGLYDQVLKKAGIEQGLDDPNLMVKVRDIPGATPAMLQNIRAVKGTWDATGDLLDTASSILDMEEKGEEILSRFNAGSPEAKKYFESTQKELGDASTKLVAKTTALYGDLGSTLSDVEAYYKQGINEYARYGQVLDALAKEIIGPSTNNTVRGELVQSPEFQRWAKSNGYDSENLGYIAKTGQYIEGPSDTDAIALYQYQLKNPDKLAPFVARGKSTGQIQTIEKKLTEEDLAAYAKTADGKYLTRETDSGTVYLKKGQDLLVNAAEKGAFVLPRQIGKSPEGTTKVQGHLLVTPKEEYREYASIMRRVDEKYEAIVAAGDAITDAEKADQLKQIDELEEMAADLDITSDVHLNGKFETIYDALAGGKPLTDDLKKAYFDVSFVNEKGQFTAADPLRRAEAFEGFSGGEDTKFATGDELIKQIAPGITISDKEPTQKYTVEMQSQHALDSKKGETKLKGTTAEGEIILSAEGEDTDWVVTDTTNLDGTFFRPGATPDDMVAIIKSSESKKAAKAEAKEDRKAEGEKRREDRLMPSTEPDVVEKDPVLKRFADKYFRSPSNKPEPEPKENETTASIDKAHRATVVDLYGKEGPIELGGGVVTVDEATKATVPTDVGIEAARDPVYDSSLKPTKTAPDRINYPNLNFDYGDLELEEDLPRTATTTLYSDQLERDRVRDMRQFTPGFKRGKVKKKRGISQGRLNLSRDYSSDFDADPAKDKQQ